jgi:hypothetical protein
MPGKYVYQRMRKVPGKPGWWPESKKIEAVTAAMSTGSLPIAASIVKVPLETIRHWKKQPWWKELEQQIHDEDNQELDSKYTRIIRKTLDVVEDRIENGNFQFDPKTGRVIRIPVNLRDTHRVMADLVTQRRVIRNEPVAQAASETVNDKLVKLAETFAQMALGKAADDGMKVVGECYENELTGTEQTTQDVQSPVQAG